MAVEPGSFEKLEFTEQICCLGKHLFNKNLPAHLDPQLRASVDLLMHVSQCMNTLCDYPNCSKGQELCRHVHIACRKERGCNLCFSTFVIVKFHGDGCTQPECTLPYCREYKVCRREKEERRRQKEERRREKARRNEERIRRLRANEASLRRFYDIQMYESIRASASAVLRLHANAKGDESKKNDVKKLLGSLLSIINCYLSRRKSRSKQRKEEEAKEQKRIEKEVKEGEVAKEQRRRVAKEHKRRVKEVKKGEEAKEVKKITNAK